MKSVMRKHAVIFFLFAGFVSASLAVVWTGAEAFAAGKSVLQGSHGEEKVLPKSCRACHRGMTMALSGDEQPCLTCHGGATERDRMTRDGYLKAVGSSKFADIEAELRKTYNHPVLTVKGVHRQFEALPEEIVNAVRHSECVDCHDPHQTEKGRPFRGLKGRRVGNFIADIEKEYELCYRCHSESANLPGNSTNKHAEFRETNPSFHPVEGEGKNTYVVSLVKPYVAKKEKPGDVSQISCSDCHGSDDANGPTGPHGSNIAGLLKLNYQMEDGRPESNFAYELCYKCHDRSSILNNESFPYHSLHIQGKLTGGGTSCFVCHDAHGSSQYQHLIRFNDEVVKENKDGKLKYDAQGYSARHGACYLNCHGIEHSPKEY